MVNNIFSFQLRCYIYPINNLAEINHIKSSNVPITQPHNLHEIDSDGGHFGFC